MPRVTVRVPGLLTRFTAGDRATVVDADTVGECLDRLAERYPALDPHLFDGAGALRAHLLVVHDGAPVDWPAARTVPVDAGDEVSILQAVSGG